MRSIVTAVVAAIEGCAAAVAGIAVIAIPAVLMWVVTFGIAAEPQDVAEAVAGVWLLAHFVPMQIVLSQETMLSMGIGPDQLSFTLTLAPLALTLITVGFAVRAGLRLSKRGGAGAVGLAGGTVGFAAIALAAATVSGDYNPWPVPGAVAVPATVYLATATVSFIVAAAIADAHWWRFVVRGMQRGFEYIGVRGGIAAFPARASSVLRLIATSFSGVILVAAISLAVAFAVGFGEVIALAQALQLDALGSAMLFLVQLAFVPVGVVWSLAWLSGAGFVVGAEYSPFVTGSSPLPMLPMLGALPNDWGSLALIAPLVLVLVNLVIGALMARRSELRRVSWPAALTLPVLAAAGTGLVVAGVCALSSGSVGPGRLAGAGPDPWMAGALVAAETAVGLLLGVTIARVDYSRVQSALPEPIARWRAERVAQSLRPEDAETVDLSIVRDDLGQSDGSEMERAAPVVDLFEAVLHERPEDTGVDDAETYGTEAFDTEVQGHRTLIPGALDAKASDLAAVADPDRDAAVAETQRVEPEVFDIEAAGDTGEIPAATEDPPPVAGQELIDPEAIERAFAWDAEGLAGESEPDVGSQRREGKRGRLGLSNWRIGRGKD